MELVSDISETFPVSIIRVDVMRVCVHMVCVYREMSFAPAWILWGTVGRPTKSNMVSDETHPHINPDWGGESLKCQTLVPHCNG
jgi:hypothetical protein